MLNLQCAWPQAATRLLGMSVHALLHFSPQKLQSATMISRCARLSSRFGFKRLACIHAACLRRNLPTLAWRLHLRLSHAQGTTCDWALGERAKPSKEVPESSSLVSGGALRCVWGMRHLEIFLGVEDWDFV